MNEQLGPNEEYQSWQAPETGALVNKDKQKAWDLKLKELDEVTDRLGEPIELGIKETVAA